ncbi:MAG: phosphoribosylglycinamide formyltransferase [Balneola sp.]|nr:MAG: phosphoribosylglycinamide formyltransferase [Balneola sp.]
MANIVVFASGSGSNFQSIINSTQSGELEAHIAGLISNKQGTGAIKKADEHSIPHAVISENDFSSYQEYTQQLISQLENWKTDLIVLAGYLRKIPEELIQQYSNRILNIHPSLLPKYGGKGFYGLKVHKAVIEAGDQVTGCTIHIVSEEYDEGPILEQVEVPVMDSDTPESLAKRVLEQEHLFYPKVISNYLKQLTD